MQSPAYGRLIGVNRTPQKRVSANESSLKHWKIGTLEPSTSPVKQASNLTLHRAKRHSEEITRINIEKTLNSQIINTAPSRFPTENDDNDDDDDDDDENDDNDDDDDDDDKDLDDDDDDEADENKKNNLIDIRSSLVQAFVNPSVAPLKISGTEDQDIEEVDEDNEHSVKCIAKIIDTEKEYISDLKQIIRNFILPIQEAKLHQLKKLNPFLDTFNLVLSVNVELLADLEAAYATQTNTIMIGSIFLKNAELFRIYKLYCSNLKGNLEEVQRLCTSRSYRSTKVRDLFEKLILQAQCEGSRGDILNSLMRPVERVNQYVTLLRQLIENTPVWRTDLTSRLRVLCDLEQLTSKTKQKKANPSELKVQQIRNLITSQPVNFLQDNPSRKYVKEGDVRKQLEGKPSTTKNRHFFLFNDLLVYCSKISQKKSLGQTFGSSATSKQYRFRGMVFVKDLLINDSSNTDELNLKQFYLSRSDTKKTYLITTKTPQEKQAWFSSLSSCILENSSDKGPVSRMVRQYSVYIPPDSNEFLGTPFTSPKLERKRSPVSLVLPSENPSILLRNNFRQQYKSASSNQYQSMPNLSGPSLSPPTSRAPSPLSARLQHDASASVLLTREIKFQQYMKENNCKVDFYAIAGALLEPEGGVPLRTRTFGLKKCKSCFVGSEAVDWIVNNMEVTREVANRIAAELMARDYFRVVSGDLNQPFLDSKNAFYHFKKGRRCLNVESIWVQETRDPITVSIELLQKLIALYRDHASLVTKFGIGAMGALVLSAQYKEFQRATAELQQVRLEDTSDELRTAFFVNIYNLLSMHSHLENYTQMKDYSMLKRLSFFKKNSYKIAGNYFRLFDIDHGLLRACSSPPEEWTVANFIVLPKIKKNDPKYTHKISSPTNLINFALNAGTISSPAIRCYSVENLHEELVKNAKEFCRAHVRVFAHSNKKKVVLPKILGWFWRDFGSTEREMLKAIRSYLTEDQQAALAFVDDPSTPLNIKYSDYQWDYKYPISAEWEAEKHGKVISDKGTIIVKTYVFPDEDDEQIQVTEELHESKYAFRIPAQILEILIPEHHTRLQELEQKFKATPETDTLEDSSSVTEDRTEKREQKPHARRFSATGVLEKYRQFIANATESLALYKNYNASYQGLTFKLSTFKDDVLLAFVPTNLHIQVMKITSSDEKQTVSYETTTVGAPAAHTLKFKSGLRQLLKEREEKLAKMKEQTDDTLHLSFELDELDLEINLRMDVCLCQAAAALVTAFSEKIKRVIHRPFIMLQYASIGFLLHVESLLSTYGSENGMLADASVAVNCLRFFAFKFVCDSAISTKIASILPTTHPINPHWGRSKDNGDQQTDFQTSDEPRFVLTFSISRSAFEGLPKSLQNEQVIPVFPVFFTQGINEQQTIAIQTNKTRLQEDINHENVKLLEQYFDNFRKFHLSQGGTYYTSSLKQELEKIAKIVRTSEREKNTAILPLTADFARKLNGGRITSCKSAKDRTAMSVTWEQARLLQKHHGLPEKDIARVTNQMRCHGVRLENAFKNTGKNRFAFNSLQLKLIPEVYRCPKSVVGGNTS